MATKLNKTDLIKEIIKCGKDPIYFILTYGKIKHPVKGLIPFRLFPYQKDIINAYLGHRKNIILKARQLGITTSTAAYVAWMVLFHRDKNVLIVSTKQDVAKTSMKMIKTILKNAPKWLTDIGKIKVDNRHSIELSNGSSVRAVTTSSDVGRSEAVSFLFIDEVAFIEKFDEIWTGLSPTISAGGSIALCSTPNGTGNTFHQLFEGAKNNENGFNCRFGTYQNPLNPLEIYNDRLMWWVHPEHDAAWFAAETNDKSPRDIAQEYSCNFNASGDTFVFHEDIARVETLTSEPKRVFQTDRNVWIWEEPEKIGIYLIPSDISRGDAKDYSAFHVLRVDTVPIKQVAEYKGKIRPDQLGVLLMSVSQFYNNALIAPENNSGWSGQTILKIEEAQYPFIYYSRRRKPKEREYAPVDPYYAATRNDYLPGYAVTSANRLQMLSKMEQYIRMGDIEINSPRLVNELKTFIMTEFNRPEAMRGYNDDLVMALAGGLWVREENPFFSYKSDEISKAILNSMSISSKNVKGFSDFNFNTNVYERGRIVEHNEQLNTIQLGNGSTEDISWLLGSKSPKGPIYNG